MTTETALTAAEGEELPMAPGTRTPLTTLRVVGTPLEHSLERVVSAAASGRAVVAAFSSSI